MGSHEEAVDMVNYHKENPASLYGKPLSFYLSKTLLVIEVRLEMFCCEGGAFEYEYLLCVTTRKMSIQLTDRRSERMSKSWSVTPGRTTCSTVRWSSSPICPERRKRRESC